MSRTAMEITGVRYGVFGQIPFSTEYLVLHWFSLTSVNTFSCQREVFAASRHAVAWLIWVKARPERRPNILKKWSGSMEIRRRAVLVGLAAIAVASNGPSFAQGALPAELKAKIIRTIGAQPDTVEMRVADNIVTILRVNSNMNQAGHAGRDNEANTIASLVAQAISAAPELKNVHTIRVQYVSRRGAGGASTVVDTVDFRKTPGGSFEFHKT